MVGEVRDVVRCRRLGLTTGLRIAIILFVAA